MVRDLTEDWKIRVFGCEIEWSLDHVQGAQKQFPEPRVLVEEIHGIELPWKTDADETHEDVAVRTEAQVVRIARKTVNKHFRLAFVDEQTASVP